MALPSHLYGDGYLQTILETRDREHGGLDETECLSEKKREVSVMIV